MIMAINNKEESSTIEIFMRKRRNQIKNCVKGEIEKKKEVEEEKQKQKNHEKQGSRSGI